jgi:hypothetical protein
MKKIQDAQALTKYDTFLATEVVPTSNDGLK